jgi:glycosyltransferase involved in cell wall biosynthesis
MGHLIEKQGVQLVLDAMPIVLRRKPEFKFKIIGDGSYSNNLKRHAREINVSDHCQFFGKMDDIIELEEEIASSCLAIAPYIKSLDNWTYFADPGKVKTYMACGVPILLTDLPWNAKEIEENKCGLIIEESKDDIAKKIIFMMEQDNNELYRKNARKYAVNYDYNTIFHKLNL